MLKQTESVISKKPSLILLFINTKSLFNFILDVVYKCNRLSKALLKKDLKLVLSEKSNLILFFLYFILLLLKINFIIKK